MTVGANINFEKSEFYYQELERTIKHFNAVHKEIVLSFSTLSFFDEMVGYHSEELESFYLDLMPYGESPIKEFTGQYSSRPNLKKAIREASQVYNAASKLLLSRVIGRGTGDSPMSYLRTLRFLSEALSSAQRADVITGAARTGIVDNVLSSLFTKTDDIQKRMSTVIDDAAFHILGLESKDHRWSWCTLQLGSD